MFSPYYAWARDRGAGDPFQYCSINVSLYGLGGKRWSMTERTARDVVLERQHFAVGPSSLHWDGTDLVIDIDEVTVPIPSRLRGTVRLTPSAVTETLVHLDDERQHRWWPIAPIADVEVALSHPDRHWRGHGYFDSNWGDVALETSFADWHWSRARSGDEATIFYDVTRRGDPPTDLSVALTFDAAGQAHPCPAPPSAKVPTTFWGIRRSVRCDAGAHPKVLSTLENAPFYARSLIATQVGGSRTEAMHESLDLDRFKSKWVQVMLPFKMPRRR